MFFLSLSVVEVYNTICNYTLLSIGIYSLNYEQVLSDPHTYMACRLFKTLPWSQRGPLHPPAQLHMNDPSLLRHCAPFWQGLVPHSNVSELVSVFQRKNQHCGPKVVNNSYVHRVKCFCLFFLWNSSIMRQIIRCLRNKLSMATVYIILKLV